MSRLTPWGRSQDLPRQSTVRRNSRALFDLPVAVRRTDGPASCANGACWTYAGSIESDSQAGKQMLDRLVAQLEAFEWIPQEVFGVHLAMEEALVNAIKHGNRHAADKRVTIEAEVSALRLFIRIRDEGPGFDPEDVPDPTDPDHLEVPSGRGIMLMRAFMTRVDYIENGTCVEMEKRRGAS